MANEIEFEKYAQRGAYHWEHYRSLHPVRRNIYTRARYQILLRQASPVKNLRVLDVGCGDGMLSRLFLGEGARVASIDLSPEGIKLASEMLSREGFSPALASASCYDMPFRSGFFDRIICTDVIEHLAEPGRMLKECARVLAPDGIFVLSTNVRLTETPLDLMHVEEFFPEAFKRLVKDDFDVVDVSMTHPAGLLELYSYTGLFGRPIFRMVLNVIDILTGKNPFLSTAGWRIFSQQTIRLRKKR